jgi:DNA-directed RNA polymerase subunit RPC12/RpoP
MAARTVHCGRCGSRLTTHATAGMTVTCPHCSSSMRLRSPRPGAGTDVGRMLLVGVALAGVGYAVGSAIDAMAKGRTYNVFISHAWDYNAGRLLQAGRSARRRS